MKARLAGRMVSVAALVVASAVPAQGQRVLHFTDFNVGTSAVPGAIGILQARHPGLIFYDALTQTDFDTQITSALWDLVIFGGQNSTGTFGESAPELAAYLAGGGKILGTDWTSAFDPSMATFFGAAHVSSNGFVVTGSGPLFVGIPSGTLNLTNPGWGVFSTGYSGAGTCYANLDTGGCAAQEGNSASTILLGPLFDTYSVQGDGDLFVANAADQLLGQTVPEPATITLFASGLIGLALVRRRRRTAA